MEVKEKGEVSIQTPMGTKHISIILYVPKINRSLLSVGQMLERNYSLHFQDRSCTIVNCKANELMKVKMMGKSFPEEWRKLEV